MTTPGTPTLVLPAFAALVFSSPALALGTAFAPVKLESNSPTAQTNVPFRFAQVFKSSDLSPENFLVGKVSGSIDVPLQFNVLATHPNGSVRHAMISGVLPTLASGATVTMSLARSASGASTSPVVASNFGSNGFSAKVLLNFSGTTYTADAGPAIAALATDKARIPGAASTEYNVAVKPSTSGGAPHPDLEARFDVVYFPSAAAFRVDVVLEHCRAFSTTSDLSYTGTIEVGGATSVTLPNTFIHFPGTRPSWQFWINCPYPVAVCPDSAYFIDAQPVSNYDRSLVIPESVLAGYETSRTGPDFAPLGRGVFNKYMPATGGRQDIGILPAYAAAAVVSMDKRAIALVKACGRIGGSWGIHSRDLGTGPGAGMPLSVVNWPYVTGILSAADVNPATGQREFLPPVSPPSTSTFVADDAHTPSFAYLPYLLTGDLFYLEEMQFWTSGNTISANYSYRGKDKGLVAKRQVRAQAWTLRGIVENAAFCPDNHPQKSHYLHWANSNLAFYNATYADNPSANPLGCLDEPAYDAVYSGGRGVGLFQDDFFTSVLGHAVELGFPAASRMLLWKAKFQIGRLLAPGYCFTSAAFMHLTIKPDGGWTTPTYTTLAQCLAATVGTYQDALGTYTQAMHDAPCNSQAKLDLLNAGQPSYAKFVLGEITGYAKETAGYPSNYQPGLAAAVDSGYTDGDLAWDLFYNRTVKPDYRTSAQFAIVPRKLTTPPPVIVVVPPVVAPPVVIAPAPAPTPAPPMPVAIAVVITNTVLSNLTNLSVILTKTSKTYIHMGMSASASGEIRIKDARFIKGDKYKCVVINAVGTTLATETPIQVINI